MRLVQITTAKRPHRPDEIGQRAMDQLARGLRHLDRGMGDHTRQHHADQDRENRHGDENVFKHGDKGIIAFRHAAHRDEIADAVEQQYRQHGSSKLEMERLGDPGQAGADAVGNLAPQE